MNINTQYIYILDCEMQLLGIPTQETRPPNDLFALNTILYGK